MKTSLYSARIGESYCLAQAVSYDVLLDRIMEFTIRAAVARSIEESEWEHEELRRRGLGALCFTRDGKALWGDKACYESELAEARREKVGERFTKANEADPLFYGLLDDDLRDRWQSAGYSTPSLRCDMKKLFLELQSEASDRAADARDSLIAEIVGHRP